MLSRKSTGNRHDHSGNFESSWKTYRIASGNFQGKNSTREKTREKGLIQVECSLVELYAISRMIPREEYRVLARFLCFPTQRIEKLESKYMTSESDDADLVYEMLTEWKRLNGKEATKDVLIETLKNIDRNDIVEEVFSGECTEKELLKVSMKILKEEQSSLAKVLGLSDEEKEKIEMACSQARSGDAEIVYQMLQTWRKKNKTEATKDVLIAAFKEIGRSDIVRETFGDYGLNHRSLTDLQIRIQAKQTNYFKNIELPQVLFLKENSFPLQALFLELTMSTENNWGENEDRSIEKEEIFERNENIIPYRIYIEGHPGYGKSTFLLKIISDWANEESYVRSKFDLVFVIPVRYFQNNLSYHLLQQCEGIHGTDEEKMNMIEVMQNRVLLLLDGLDEASDSAKENILPLLKRDVYPTMTVIVTCRTGMLHSSLKTSEDFQSTKTETEEKYVWDKNITIAGVSDERREEFIQKYFEVDYQKINEKLESSIKLKYFYECPVILLLLAVLIHVKDSCFISSKTELYKTIFNFLINNNVVLEKEIDVFDFENANGYEYRTLLTHFGKLCLQKIKTHSSSFEKTEFHESLTGNFLNHDMIIKLGFFSKETLLLFDEEKIHYKLIHKSFIDFLAAFYLSSFPRSDMIIEIQELMANYDIWPNEDQLLYVFLGGFLQSNADVVFTALSYHKDIISIFDDERFCNVESILIEIPITDEILNSLMPFSSTIWKDVKYDPLLNDWYINLFNHFLVTGIKHNISLKFPENLHLINFLPGNFEINEIILDFNKLEKKESVYEWKRTKIRCENLIIHLNASSIAFPFSIKHLVATATAREVPFSSKSLLTNMEAQKIWLNVNFHDLKPEFVRLEVANFTSYKLSVEDMFFKIHSLSLHKVNISYFKYIFFQIRDLLNLKRLRHGLNVTVSSVFKQSNATDGEINAFMELVFKSHLNLFGFAHIFNDPVSSPFYFSNRKQPRELLGLKGKFRNMSIEEIEYFPVEHLYCIHLTLENKILLSKLLLKCTGIKRVSCCPELICDLSEYTIDSAWEGLDTIEQIDLSIEWGVANKESFLLGISLFKNVKEVCLMLSFIDHQHSDFLFKLVSSLPTMRKFSLCFVVSKSDQFLMELLKKLLSGNEERFATKTQLEEFQVDGLHTSIYAAKTFLSIVEKCLLKQVFIKFSTLDKAVWREFEFIKHYLSKKEFKVFSEWDEEICVHQLFASNPQEFPKLNQKLCITVTGH